MFLNNYAMRNILIIIMLLCCLTSCRLSYNEMRHSNKSDKMVSIKIHYKQPMTIAKYQNFSILRTLIFDYLYPYNASYIPIQKYDTVYVDEQPKNFELEYALQDIPRININDNGDINLDINTAGRFICQGNQATIEILPHKTVTMYKLVWLSNNSSEERDLYTNLLEKITIRQGMQEKSYTEYDDLYRMFWYMNLGLTFRNGKFTLMSWEDEYF